MRGRMARELIKGIPSVNDRNKQTYMKTNRTNAWTAGVEMYSAPPPPAPPPGPPLHPHGPPPPPHGHPPHPHGIPPHVLIIQGLEAVSAQVAELQATVDEMHAAPSVAPA